MSTGKVKRVNKKDSVGGFIVNDFLYSLAERKYELYRFTDISETPVLINEGHLSRTERKEICRKERYAEVVDVIDMLPLEGQKTVEYYFNILRRRC